MMSWPNQPIPLGPLYYTFWAMVLVGAVLIILWLPELRSSRVALTWMLVGGLVLFVIYVWR